MKTKEIIVLIIAIIFLAFGLFLLNKCNHQITNLPNPQTSTSQTHQIIPGDTVIKHDTIYMPKPDTIYSDPEIITLPPDSMLMIEYLKLYERLNLHITYNDTLRNDTSALITLQETIYKNQLQKRIIGFQNRRPIAINTTINTTIINNKGFFGGANVGKNIFTPSILYLNNNIMYGGGYDFYNKTPVLTFFYKIK